MLFQNSDTFHKESVPSYTSIFITYSQQTAMFMHTIACNVRESNFVLFGPLRQIGQTIQPRRQIGQTIDGLCSVVVGIVAYYARGRGFDSRTVQTFVCMNMSVVGLGVSMHMYEFTKIIYISMYE
jgi:hypothetical protein